MIDTAFASHVVLWVIGGLSTITGIAIVGALFSLGRGSYRKG